jgi:hypothetical protein
MMKKLPKVFITEIIDFQEFVIVKVISLFRRESSTNSSEAFNTAYCRFEKYTIKALKWSVNLEK